MKTLIKKSNRQLKILKKIRKITMLMTQAGFAVTCAGYVGFLLVMLKTAGPALMMTAFAVGVPIMILGSLANELTVYQEVRLRSKIRKYARMIETIRHRHDEPTPVYNQADSGRQEYQPVHFHAHAHRPLVCHSV